MKKSRINLIVTSREFILAALLVAASLIISIFTPVFLSKTNLLSIYTAITVNGVIAIGMVMLLTAGEMDLSVGMTMAFTGVVVSKLIVAGVPLVIAILVGFAVAALIGLVNGFLVSKVGLNAFITTLGVNCCIEGLMLVDKRMGYKFDVDSVRYISMEMIYGSNLCELGVLVTIYKDIDSIDEVRLSRLMQKYAATISPLLDWEVATTKQKKNKAGN